MNWLKSLFKRELVFKYTRIKKPKKDEYVIFHLPDVTPVQKDWFVQKIKELNTKKSGYLIFSGDVKIRIVKKKEIKNEPKRSSSTT